MDDAVSSLRILKYLHLFFILFTVADGADPLWRSLQTATWALFSHPRFELKIPSHDFVEQFLRLAMLGFSPRPSDISDHFPEEVPRIEPVALKKPNQPVATSWSPKTPVTPQRRHRRQFFACASPVRLGESQHSVVAVGHP